MMPWRTVIVDCSGASRCSRDLACRWIRLQQEAWIVKDDGGMAGLCGVIERVAEQIRLGGFPVAGARWPKLGEQPGQHARDRLLPEMIGKALVEEAVERRAVDVRALPEVETRGLEGLPDVISGRPLREDAERSR